jgi:peptidoglycan/LPS O-acetylase OafA/YrhL
MTKKFIWLDIIKAFALIWIVINHIVEQVFGYPYIANPTYDWPQLSDRIAQLKPLTEYGSWTIPINILRYIGWTGDQGVQLFLIASGFGLTWGLLARYGKNAFPIRNFYKRRGERLYPLWWGAHLAFIALWLLIGWGLSITDPRTYLSMAGIRFTPNLFYYFSPAWWFIGLLIQLYLIFPFLWSGLQRLGPLRLLLISCIIGFAARAFGIYFFEGYLDAWLRGAIFFTRLPEFVLGISLAAWMFYSYEKTVNTLYKPISIILAIIAYIIGFALSITLAGMIIAPFLMALSGFIVLFVLFDIVSRKIDNNRLKPFSWIGDHSYSLYLMHHPLILFFVPVGIISSQGVITSVFVAILLTFVSAIALEFTVSKTTKIINNWYNDKGIIKTSLRVAGTGIFLGVLLGGLLIVSELIIRKYSPREILGWGERPSLELDETFGWRLKPSQETQLRWEGYDYIISANSLGFPGPQYPIEKNPNTLRILVTGDAFSSAEGVDTNDAWPRLLETELVNQLGIDVEVMNFAITGYGPNQYLKVISEFAPIYRPDIILIELFINDFQDIQISDEEFQQSIGFHLPPQDGVMSIIKLEHLHRYIQLIAIEPLLEIVRDQPRLNGYFLGHFSVFERDGSSITETSRSELARRLAEITDYANQVDAQTIVLLAPASIQVCQPEELAYFPRNIDFTDDQRFNVEFPQKTMNELTSELNIPYYDLLYAFKNSEDECPYHSHNMHWTEVGHKLVANYVANIFIENQMVNPETIK